MRAVPIERMLIETDSPYLTPVPHRGERNDPGKVKYVAQKIAEIKEMEYEAVVDMTRQNALRVF